eukprot:GHVH01002080.1.p1 GENE.GHVH01002080.1~~GHVH01002080.1.p1  ORF type:complete len:194 (+),score=21.30 GHVH01002080.1:316-897(+)
MGTSSPFVMERITHHAALIGLITPANDIDIHSLDLNPLTDDLQKTFNYKTMSRFTDNAILLKRVKKWAIKLINHDTNDLNLIDISGKISFKEIGSRFDEILSGPFSGLLKPTVLLAAVWAHCLLTNSTVYLEEFHCCGETSEESPREIPSVARLSALIYFIGQNVDSGRSETDKMAIFLRTWMTKASLISKLK